MKVALTLITGILLSSWSYAQEDCACCGSDYQDFNFWVGEWEVYDTAGNIIGWNTIEYKQDSCVIRENWRSRISTGTSYSYYDRKTGKWNQLWIDNSGGNLSLQGTAGAKSMSMYGQASDSSLHRIRWTAMDNGEVEQRWDVISLDQEILATLFIGYYRKVEEDITD